MTWSPSTKVMSLTSPLAMYSFICDALISSPPPELIRNCMAMSTPTTATTIQISGPLKMRFTDFSQRRTWVNERRYLYRRQCQVSQVTSHRATRTGLVR